PTSRQPSVSARGRLVVARLERQPVTRVPAKDFPLIGKCRAADVGGGGIVEADEEREGKLVTEEERRRIRHFPEWGGAHSESVHEVELQRARRAEPATGQIGWPLEHGLARGYISDSNNGG